MKKNLEKAAIGINNKDEWDVKWVSIFDHYQQDLRHAHYVRSLLNANEKNVLELAAGSFRDAAALNNWGYSCSATDYSQKAVDLAVKEYPNFYERFNKMDSFKLSFADKAFDISYHNGFWVLFNDDSDIIKLAEEQARVSKYRIIATVHNKHNIEFLEYFKQLSEKDELYKIRFFETEEIEQLMMKVCKTVQIIPVGKGKKFQEDLLIKNGYEKTDELKRLFQEAGHTYLKSSERLLCIGTL